MDLGLKGKIAFVGGASRGLGAATARLLSQEGARVAINSRQAAELQAKANEIQAETGSEVLAVPGDLSAASDVERALNNAAEHFGGLDILVSNAGGPPAGRFEDFDDADWSKAIDQQLLSTVRLIRAALPHLRRSHTPSVLTVTSITVKQPIANLVLSNSIRLAVIGLTKTLALELGNEGIRFNSILPASTYTDRLIGLMRGRAQANGTTFEEEETRQAANSILGRISSVEEFANAAVFLCSPAASFLTGVMLPIDGGIYKGVF